MRAQLLLRLGRGARRRWRWLIAALADPRGTRARGCAPALHRPGAALAVSLPALGIGLQRIAAGRHFLSDTVFAALFVMADRAWSLHRLLPDRRRDG